MTTLYNSRSSNIFYLAVIITIILLFLLIIPRNNSILIPSQQHSWLFSPINFSSQDRVMIISPHPDDAALATAGVIQKAEKAGADIKVVYITCGDHNTEAMIKNLPIPITSEKLGTIRHQEAERAMRELGVKRAQLVFLGFPDFGTLKIWTDHWNSKPYFAAITLHNKTFYTFSYKRSIPFTASNELKLLEQVISDFKPTKIFYPAPSDLNPDHRATGLFVESALNNLLPVKPIQYLYFVHAPDWPTPKELFPEGRLLPPNYIYNLPRQWGVVSLNSSEEKSKELAIAQHKSQVRAKPSFMKAFVRTDELFLLSSKNKIGEPLPLWNKRTSEKLKIIPAISQVVVDDNNQFLTVRIKLYKEIKAFNQINLFIYPYSSQTSFSLIPKYRFVLTQELGGRIKTVLFNGKGQILSEKIEQDRFSQGVNQWEVHIAKRYLTHYSGFFSAIEVELAHLRISETPWWNIQLPHTAIADIDLEKNE